MLPSRNAIDRGDAVGKLAGALFKCALGLAVAGLLLYAIKYELTLHAACAAAGALYWFFVSGKITDAGKFVREVMEVFASAVLAALVLNFAVNPSATVAVFIQRPDVKLAEYALAGLLALQGVWRVLRVARQVADKFEEHHPFGEVARSADEKKAKEAAKGKPGRSPVDGRRF